MFIANTGFSFFININRVTGYFLIRTNALRKIHFTRQTCGICHRPFYTNDNKILSTSISGSEDKDNPETGDRIAENKMLFEYLIVLSIPVNCGIFLYYHTKLSFLHFLN